MGILSRIFNRSAPASKPRAEAFTFGDPVPVLDGQDFLSYLQIVRVGKWYDTPVPWEAIARSSRAAVHHAAALQLKRDVLASTFIPHKYLSRSAFTRWAHDYLLFGNGYLERRDSRLGNPLSLDPPLAKYVRRGIELDQYFYVPQYSGEYSNVVSVTWEDHEFKKGSIFHLVEFDPNQDVYGLPYYLAGLSSAWLNEAATLFRRKYYLNGSHAGFILYVTDPAKDEADITNLRQALKDSKGPGNFRNLFYYSPNGKKDGIHMIPIAEVMSKDEFFNIKNVTRDDQLAAHRTPPQLMGVVPANTGGFGDALSAAKVFAANELEPLQARFLELNDWLGEEVVRFRPYSLAADPGGQGDQGGQRGKPPAPTM